MKPFLDAIMGQIKIGLQGRGWVFQLFSACTAIKHNIGRKMPPRKSLSFNALDSWQLLLAPIWLNYSMINLTSCSLAAWVGHWFRRSPLLRNTYRPFSKLCKVCILGNSLLLTQHLTQYILDRLLDLLSNILSGQPYKPLGAPPNLGRNDITAINRDLNSSQVCGEISFFLAFQWFSIYLFRSMGLTKVQK